jgi:hypothetical protein
MIDVQKIYNNIRRHAAMSMEMKGGTSPITAMCPCGTFIEIYKRDKTFRLKSPELIDPEGINPNAPWVASPVANVGSSNLIIARVLLQAKQMLDAAMIEGPFDKDATISKLHACKESLLACEKVAHRIAQNIDEIVKLISEHGVARDNRGWGLNPFPQASELELDCGALLIHANRCIKLICELPTLFLTLERTDSNFDHLSKRLSEALGDESPVTTFVRENARGVRYLVDLRNCHEHPKKVKTVIENFRVLPDGQIQAPVWYLQGDAQREPHPIKEEALGIVDFLRELAEIMFIHLLIQRVSTKFPFFIAQVPDEEVAPDFPVRYKLSIDFSGLHARRLQPER